MLEAAHRREGARAVVYALILARTDGETMQIARALLEAHEGVGLAEAAMALREPIAGLGAEGRLPLIDIVLPTLKGLAGEDRRRFLAAASALVRADRRLTLFEFVLGTILDAHLGEEAGQPDRIEYTKSDQVLIEIRILLSLLATAGTSDPALRVETFKKVISYFSRVPLEPADLAELKPERLAEALGKLARLSPLVKQSLVTACADCVLHDGKVMPAEAELLRAIALSLDCPMPPLLPPRG